MTKRISALVVVTIFCFTAISFGTSYAAGRKGKGRARVGRGGRIGNLARPLVVAPVVVKPLGPVRPQGATPPAAVPYEGPAVGPAVGLAGGLFANLPSLAGEIWFHKILGINGTGLKAGLRYAQGDDANGAPRKDVLAFADGVINLNSGPGAIFYAAGGLNYLAYTTGRTSGNAGAEAYLGVQEGAFYVEAGYSEIRPGFIGPSKGLDINLGIKAVY